MANELAGEQTQTEAQEIAETIADEQPVEESTDDVEESTEEQPEPKIDESIEDYKKKIATLEAQKNHYRDKASKRDALETSTRADMSPADLVAVMNAGVHEDDMERVERFSIAEGVSIREATISAGTGST